MGVGGSVSLATSLTSILWGDYNTDGVSDFVSLNSASGTGLHKVYLSDTTLAARRTSQIHVEDQETSQEMLGVLDRTLDTLNEGLASLGAQQNRLEFALSNQLILSENLEEAKSRIIDSDLAEETAEFTRLQILQQAGMSVLGQANVNVRLVLNLLLV